ncbi:MAG: helix-turn-helix transcriptional regulator [Anaerotignum sp.]|nr:helix-turn-helix transcriptional regulator [Anaerotignum sp.]
MNKSQLTFGHKLRELREDKGLTQEQLAERIGITANAVGQFERGKIFPNYETTANIINVLDVDANLLFSRDTVDYPDEAKWIAKIMVDLNIEERQKFGKFLEDISKIFINSCK